MTLYSSYWNLILFIGTAYIALYWGVYPDWRWFNLCVLFTLASIYIPVLSVGLFAYLAISIIVINSYFFQLKTENLFLTGGDIIINARIDSFFNEITHGNEFLIKIEEINGRKLHFYAQPSVKLISPKSMQLMLGEKWQLNVKAKPIYGKLNEAGFDQEKYFLSQDWQGKVIVNESADNKRLSPSHSFRLYLYQLVYQQTKSLDNQPLLLALSFGDRNAISAQQWQQLKASGLIHLVAISGLHIGVSFLIGWKFGIGIRWLFPSGHWVPLLFACALAWGYSWLAGFSLPTLRALIMCVVLACLHLIRLDYSRWLKLLIALTIVILIHPFSMLSTSFWMSFGAVTTIYLLLSSPLMHSMNVIKKMAFMQLGLTVLMLPMTIYFFNGLSLFSPLYNLIFLPLFSVVIVPLIFISLLFTLVDKSISAITWQWVDSVLQAVLWSADLAKISWVVAPANLGLWLLAVLVILLIRPLMSRQLNWFCLISLSTLFLIESEIDNSLKAKRQWQLSVLDVGHGLAILINKERKHILYDTGNRWQGGSIAESIIIPVLLNRRVTRIDGLILSHLDSDHAGGREIIEQQFAPSWKLASQRFDGYQPCIKGNAWQWQNLNFSILWPPRIVSRAYNPHSCVIRIDDGFNTVLLTGDIDAVAELLLAKSGQELSADVIIVPHHGSSSSSRLPFLQKVLPQLSIASIAKGNQWNLPSEKVLGRYQRLQSVWLDTRDSGQINIDFSPSGWKVFKIRDRQSYAWYRQMLRKGVE